MRLKDKSVSLVFKRTYAKYFVTAFLSLLIYRLRLILLLNLKSTEIFMICISMLTKCSEFLIKRIYRKYESIINNISTSNSKATSAYMRLGKKKTKTRERISIRIYCSIYKLLSMASGLKSHS